MTRMVGVTPSGQVVQFEADAQPVESDASPFRIGSTIGAKTAVATSGAATLNKESGAITSESLSTAAAGEYTLTLTNSKTLANDLVFASVQLGTATTGAPSVRAITPTAGQIVFIVRNVHASAALNGTIVISFISFRM